MTTAETLTIRQSAEEFDATGFIFCDRGNGSGFGEDGQFVRIDEDTLESYGDIEMHRLDVPLISQDGFEIEWLSGWIVGDNGYEYRIGV